MDRIGLRLHLRKQQAEAGDMLLLYGDESEASAHPDLARAWAKSGADLRVPAPGQAKKMAMLGSLDHLMRQILAYTSPTKRSCAGAAIKSGEHTERTLRADGTVGSSAVGSSQQIGADDMALPPRLAAFQDRIQYVKAPAQDATTDTGVIAGLVGEVLADVRGRGDTGVREYARRFDKVEVEALEVTPSERRMAVDKLERQTRADTEFAIERVRAFAEAQLTTILPLESEPLPGLHLGHRVIPIERVGCYVPGGRYPLLSAPVMTIVPGKVAGCDEVVACLPPTAHPAMIASCHLSGADRIFRIGGAQAIAAMAYGTESVPGVDKIVGPGNAYVNEAKRQVFGTVGIDQLAGPSEIFVVADATGNAEMIAIDLLAQAEHDVRTRVGVITTDRALAGAMLREVERQLGTLSTADVAGTAWRDYGEVVLCADEATMIAYSDHIAAEHLQVHTADAKVMAGRLRNYGSLFIGELASVVYSDKCCGTNHTLPTMGAGRYTGGLWVGSFVKICTHQWLDERGVAAVAPPAVRQSASEGLEGHRRAAALRLRGLQRFPAAHDSNHGSL